MAAGLLATALLGVALSIHTLRAMRCAAGSCDAVMSTRYARLFGFPNAWIALAYHAAVAAFAVARLAGARVPIEPVLVASAMSLVMSAVLAYLLVVKLRRF
jgi:uncharacterized membrane protein